MVLILSIFNNSPVAYAASHNISISYFENYYSMDSIIISLILRQHIRPPKWETYGIVEDIGLIMLPERMKM